MLQDAHHTASIVCHSGSTMLSEQDETNTSAGHHCSGAEQKKPCRWQELPSQILSLSTGTALGSEVVCPVAAAAALGGPPTPRTSYGSSNLVMPLAVAILACSCHICWVNATYKSHTFTCLASATCAGVACGGSTVRCVQNVQHTAQGLT